MISPLEYMRDKEEDKILSPAEYMKNIEKPKILSPDEYMRDESTSSILSPEQYSKGVTKTPFQDYAGYEEPFAAKHPVLHSIGGAAKETAKDLTKVSWLKLLHSDERKKFTELTGHGKDAKWWQAKTQKQAQVRDLLLADLEAVALWKAKPIIEGIKPVVSGAMKRLFPKTFERLTKVRGMERAVPKIIEEKVTTWKDFFKIADDTELPPEAIDILESIPTKYLGNFNKDWVGKIYRLFAGKRKGGVDLKYTPGKPHQTFGKSTRGHYDPIKGEMVVSPATPENQFYTFAHELGHMVSANYRKGVKRIYNEESFAQQFAIYLSKKKGFAVPDELKPQPFFSWSEMALKRKPLTVDPEYKKIFDTILKPTKARGVVTARPEVIDDPVQEVVAALKEVPSKRKIQEQIYTTERKAKLAKGMTAAEKVTGEKRFGAMLKKFKGEMTKVEFESLRGKVSQKNIDKLFDMIWESSEVTGWDKTTAMRGLARLFGEYGGGVPQRSEREFLKKVFPEEFIQALLSKRTLFQKMKEGGLQLANIPRSIMASYDLSAPLRQGLVLGVRNPKRFAQAFGKMFKEFGSEKAFIAAEEAIAEKPTYELMKKSGLALTKMGKQMTSREEAFTSQWAEKIPIVGRGIRASGRAHTGFLNKLRADVFEDLIVKAENLGRNPRNNLDLTKEIARFVNAASGRGSLGGLENSAVALNAFFFSPRLMASRLSMFNRVLNPVSYVRADPFVRKEALKSMLTLSGVAGTILGAAKAGGADVSLDYRSADFLKIKIGSTRIDILGGFQQYMRAAGQLISGQYVSSTTGKVVTLGEGYKPLTRLDILHRQIESKEAPIASFATTLLKGQDITGKDVSVPKEIAQRLVPMAMSDIYDIAQENPELLPISWLGMFGVGLQTYGPTRRNRGGIRGIGGIR